MAFGTLTQKLRPLRFAFLVDPLAREATVRALELSSMLWGGMFNPVIPVFRHRLPKSWAREPYFRRSTPEEITNGYLEGFDPDLIVTVADSFEGKFDVGNREVITPEQLSGEFSKDGTPGYGIGIFEVARHIAKEEFRFVRQAPLNVILPRFPSAHRLFLTAVFGGLPDEVSGLLRQHLSDPMGITEPLCTIGTFDNFLGLQNLFPRRMGAAEIEYLPREATVYCLDASNILDVLDYWNLRAAGFYVIPAPKQAYQRASLRELVRSFVIDHYRPHRDNPDYYFHTVFQVGRSMTTEEVTSFANALDIPPANKQSQPKFLIRPWYPRLWDRWARLETEERVEQFFSSERATQLGDDTNNLDIQTLGPSFDQPRLFSGKARFANELSYSVYGAESPVAEVLPEGSRRLARRVAKAGLHDFRLSRTGPVYLASGSEQRLSFEIPKSVDFMLNWLKDAGWKAELSQAGRVAHQMLTQLRGKFGVSVIAHEGVIKLLDKHASERFDSKSPDQPRASKWIVESSLNAELDRILKLEGSFITRERYLALLRERDVLRLGLQLHCPTCSRWLWKALGELAEHVECEHCLTRFSIPASAPNDRRWSFKPIGPFNVRNFAGGAYAVLLAWKFFSGPHDRATTPLWSFEAEKDGKKLGEVDLALFCRDGMWRAPKTELLFAECKSYDAIQEKDIRRMTQLGEQFQGSILVFAKLGRDLASAEVRLLLRLVNRQRRLWRAGKPHSAVMVLTGTELFSDRGAPECWNDKGGKFDKAYKTWRYIRSLRELAEITQSLYLDLPSLHQWADAERAKRRALKQAARK